MKPSTAGRIARAAALVPWALPTAVLALAWKWVFNDQYGVFNQILMSLHLIDQPIAWLGKPGARDGVAHLRRRLEDHALHDDHHPRRPAEYPRRSCTKPRRSTALSLSIAFGCITLPLRVAVDRTGDAVSLDPVVRHLRSPLRHDGRRAGRARPRPSRCTPTARIFAISISDTAAR